MRLIPTILALMLLSTAACRDSSDIPVLAIIAGSLGIAPARAAGPPEHAQVELRIVGDVKPFGVPVDQDLPGPDDVLLALAGCGVHRSIDEPVETLHIPAHLRPCELRVFMQTAAPMDVQYLAHAPSVRVAPGARKVTLTWNLGRDARVSRQGPHGVTLSPPPDAFFRAPAKPAVDRPEPPPTRAVTLHVRGNVRSHGADPTAEPPSDARAVFVFAKGCGVYQALVEPAQELRIRKDMPPCTLRLTVQAGPALGEAEHWSSSPPALLEPGATELTVSWTLDPGATVHGGPPDAPSRVPVPPDFLRAGRPQ